MIHTFFVTPELRTFDPLLISTLYSFPDDDSGRLVSDSAEISMDDIKTSSNKIITEFHFDFSILSVSKKVHFSLQINLYYLKARTIQIIRMLICLNNCREL